MQLTWPSSLRFKLPDAPLLEEGYPAEVYDSSYPCTTTTTAATYIIVEIPTR